MRFKPRKTSQLQSNCKQQTSLPMLPLVNHYQHTHYKLHVCLTIYDNSDVVYKNRKYITYCIVVRERSSHGIENMHRNVGEVQTCGF